MRYVAILSFIVSLLATQAMADVVTTSPTISAPINITTGATFQQALAALTGSKSRNSITIENNNTTSTELCYLLIGGPWQAGDTLSSTRTVSGVSLTAAKAAVLLLSGQAYTRYYPFIPSDQILATCTTTNDSLYIDTQ